MGASMKKAPVTLHDVAREAGVSLATASRALNGSTRTVNEAYRERVLAAAARLDYRPNLSAQAVARGASSTVALLVSDIADPYSSSIAAGVIREAEADRLIVTMAMTERDAGRELALVRALRGQRPRIMILAGTHRADADADAAISAELQAYENTGGRVVLISQRRLPFDTIQLDNLGGAGALGSRLVGIGYRRFAIIAGAQGLITSDDRVRGFTEALAEHGVTVLDEHVVHAAFTRDGGFEAAGDLVSRGIADVDLVFVVDDVMAVGAMSAFRDAGIRLPEDLAIAGYDDIATARDVTPPLTTVRVPLADIGTRAMELALRDRGPGEGEGEGEGVVTIPSEVVLRDSTPDRSA